MLPALALDRTRDFETVMAREGGNYDEQWEYEAGVLAAALASRKLICFPVSATDDLHGFLL